MKVDRSMLKKTSIEMPIQLWKRGKICAVYQQRDFRDVLNDALSEYLERHAFEINAIEYQNRLQLEAMEKL